MQHAPEVFFCSSCLPDMFAKHPEKVDVRQKHYLAAVAFLDGKFASANAAAVAFRVRQQRVAVWVRKLKKIKDDKLVATMPSPPLTTLFPPPPISRAVHDGTRLVALDIAVQRCVVERSKFMNGRKRKSVHQITHEVNKEMKLVGSDKLGSRTVSRYTAARGPASTITVPVAPKRTGRPGLIPPEVEAIIRQRMQMCAQFAVNFSVDQFRGQVSRFLKRLHPGLAALFPDGVPGRKWARGFLRRAKYPMETEHIREAARANWAKKEYIIYWYNMIASVLMRLRLAVQDDARLVSITKPGRICCFDETDIKTDLGSTKPRKVIGARANRTGGRDERPIAFGYRDSQKKTLVLGSFANGDPLPPCIIYQAAGDVREAWKTGGPQVHSHGQLRDTVFLHNGSGGMTQDLLQTYIERVILPCFPPGDVTPDNPILILMDGVQTHVPTIDTLDWCTAQGINLALRIPYTTHIMQNEDVLHFGLLKGGRSGGLWGKAKWDFYESNPTTALTNDNYLAVLAPAVEKVLQRATNAAGWAKVGLHPFTRCVEDNFEVQQLAPLAAALADAATAPTARIETAGAPDANAGAAAAEDMAGVAAAPVYFDPSFNLATFVQQPFQAPKDGKVPRASALWSAGTLNDAAPAASIRRVTEARAEKAGAKAHASAAAAATAQLKDEELLAEGVRAIKAEVAGKSPKWTCAMLRGTLMYAFHRQRKTVEKMSKDDLLQQLEADKQTTPHMWTGAKAAAASEGQVAASQAPPVRGVLAPPSAAARATSALLSVPG